MPKITFEKENKVIEVPAGMNLRKVARKNGISIYRGKDKLLNCMGNGFCGTCRVEIVSGTGASPKTPGEDGSLIGNFVFAKKPTSAMRLSCQVTVNGDIVVRTQPAVELDKEETKRRLVQAAVFGVFALVLLFVFIVLFLDLKGSPLF
jgi:ferredoxin